MNIPYVFKRCSKCGQWLVANNIYFNKKKGGKYSLRSECKKCEKKYKKQYYQENKEHYQECNKQHYQENKERYQECSRKWKQNNKEYYKQQQQQYRQENKERQQQYRQENKEQITKYNKQYYQNNKEQIAEYSKQYYQSPQGQVTQFNANNRRRQKEEQQGRGITDRQWLEMMNFFNWEGAYSGIYVGGRNKNRSVDHIIPLDKGGLNEPWNCVPMYKPYNSSKGTRDMLEWYKEQPFFSEERLAKIYAWQEYAFNKWGQDVAM